MNEFEFKGLLLDVISLFIVFVGGFSVGVGAGTGVLYWSYIGMGCAAWVVALFINYISYKRVGRRENV